VVTQRNPPVWEGTPEYAVDVARTQAYYAGTSVDEFRGRIEAVHSIDSTELSCDEVRTRVRALVAGHDFLEQYLDVQGIWRARLCINKDLFENVFSQLWCPYPENSRMNRFNAKGESVFYCSLKARMAVFEVRPTIGEWITVLAAKAKHQVARLRVFTLGLEACHDPILKYLRYEGARAFPPLRKILGDEDAYLKWRMIDDFVGTMASRPVPPGNDIGYRATVALARELMHIFPDADGFIYPSVGTELHGVNLMLTRDAVNHHFEPLACDVYAIDRSVPPPDVFGVSRLASSKSIAADGSIAWESLEKSTEISLRDLPIREMHSMLPDPFWRFVQTGSIDSSILHPE
jgi:hypothetical protein